MESFDILVLSPPGFPVIVPLFSIPLPLRLPLWIGYYQLRASSCSFHYKDIATHFYTHWVPVLITTCQPYRDVELDWR